MDKSMKNRLVVPKTQKIFSQLIKKSVKGGENRNKYQLLRWSHCKTVGANGNPKMDSARGRFPLRIYQNKIWLCVEKL